MTGDEAFIRAIVDHPGDDTPRLVYADWLNDRDDPRGAYLRAEAEWARPWREGQRPKDSPKLRDLAAGLDPVWVARVSRPPLGVCCDHVRFEESGPPVTAADLDRLENHQYCRLPSEYRALLLNHNGGKPFPSDTPETEAYLGVSIDRFYSVAQADIFRSSEGGSEIARYRDRLPHWLNRASPETVQDELDAFRRFLPIAQLGDDIFELVIGPVGGPYEGQLVFVDWTVGPPPIGYYNIPSTLPKLFAELSSIENP